MSELSKNTFEGGIQQDIDIALSKGNTILYGENVRIVSYENTNYIITNIKGTDIVGTLKPNYWCKGVKVSNGIAYIVSSEIINDVATGRGELGCFPSPDYTTGNITKDYRALRNYKGDDGTHTNYDGELNSVYFNFVDKVRLEVEIQQEYDGSVNVVFTDGINPIRIINSGFSKIGTKYKKIERVGANDSNKYDKDTWNSTMSLIQGFSTLSQVELNDIISGGNLTSGNYTFFFRYSTVEKNKTDITCQTFPISVYSGTSLTGSDSIKAGVTNSSKSVSLLLSGLDTSYAFIHVDYALETSTGTVYKSITDDYPISSTELEIIISGDENAPDVTEEEVGQLVTVFDYAKTITQIQNRLVPANVGKSERNYTLLRKFAAYIIPKYKEIQVEAKHNQGVSAMTEVEDLSTKSSFGNGRSWNIGYANAKNIYLRRGYWGGETYSFGVRFIFKDLTVSPVFPTFGYDDQLGTTTYVLNDALKTTISSLIDGNTSGYSSTDTQNINGVYRFPTRTSINSNSLLSNNGLNTFAVSLEIPDLDTILEDGKTVLDEVVGIEVVRSERIKDCLFQGVGFACYPFHTGNPTGDLVWNQRTELGGAPGGRGEFTSVMPLVRGVLPVNVYSSRYAASIYPIVNPDNPLNRWQDDFLHPKVGKVYSHTEGDSVTGSGDISNWNVLMHQNQEAGNVQLSQAGVVIDGFNINQYTGIYSPELISNINELSPLINGAVNLGSIRLGRQASVTHESNINSIVPNEIPNDGLVGSGTRYFTLENVYSPQLFYVTSVNKTGNSSFTVTNANFITEGIENLNNFKSFLSNEKFLHYPELQGHIVTFPVSNNTKTPPFWGVKGVSLLEDLQGYACYASSTGRTAMLTYYENYPFYNVVSQSGGDYALIAPYNVKTSGIDYVRFTDSGDYFNFFNVYLGNGLTSWDSIKARYSTASLKYTPISQKLFLTTGVKNAVYSSSVLSAETGYTELYYDDDFKNRNALIPSGNSISKAPTFWGGDCYIAPYIIKTVTSEGSNRGIYASVFLESSVNPILLNESDTFPFTQSRLDNGGDLPSSSVNSGYLKTISKVPYTSLDFNSPFIKVEFDTRVYYSDLHVQNNLKNGYKVFGLANHKDYTKHLGPIIKVVNIKNTLFLIQQTGISVIPFNERVTSAQSETGSIYVKQSDILSQYVVTYSEVYGTNLQFACIPTSDNLFVLDLNNFKIVTLTPGRGIEFVSDLKLESFIRRYLQSFLGKDLDFTNLDIVGFDHTANHKEVVWTFYDKSDPTKLKNISLAYNVALKEFTSFYSMVPYQTFGLDGIQYAFNSKTNPEVIHSLETNPIRNLIFEETEKAIVRFKVSSHYEFEKVFDNISVISNNVLPDNVLYYVDGGNTNQTINYDPVNIHLSNAKHREGVTYITIPRVENITDKDATEFLDALYTNALSQLNTVDVTNDKARFKGKSIIIELQYSTDKQLKLNSVLTQYRISNS